MTPPAHPLTTRSVSLGQDALGALQVAPDMADARRIDLKAVNRVAGHQKPT
ncbi:hypothetical protein [uncultured Paracoccus sp.]|uniref:hypothetical protein n=1 Tax=uncultured Paracoccus sp. TaxID=189685 RepID=UPI0026042623|nr:hypothetical protein [uncultured Paracoccus sp.]